MSGSDELRMRYETAERLLPHQWGRLIRSGRVAPQWVSGGDLFWYRKAAGPGTLYVEVDPASAARRPLFDHDAMATALSAALGRPVDPTDLPIGRLDVRGSEPLRFEADAKTWAWDRLRGTLTLLEETPLDPFFHAVSPDRHLSVSTSDHNLVLRDRRTGTERALSEDGQEGYSWGTPIDICTDRFTLDRFGVRVPPAVAWAPDSRRFVSHRVDQRSLPFMHYVQSSPPEGGRPRFFSQRYAMTGEEALPTCELAVVDVESGRITWADCGAILMTFISPIRQHHLWWDDDGARIYFISTERGDRVFRLCSLDPDTGQTEVLIEETSDTQVQIHPLWLSGANVRVLKSGEIVWWSERTSWGHLYLYAPDGSVRALTSGAWLVRDLVSVDEDARVVVFSASGREASLDPYARQLYRVSLDGGPIERISHDLLDHDATGSPSGRYLVDVAAWVDTPDVSSLLTADGDVVVELEQADVDPLYAAGWVAPERVTVKAADGETDLFGLLYRPHGFDPASRYPLLEDIYPGPQRGAASVRFCDSRLSPHAASMAALGFAVLVVDARGTPFRGKAFHEHCRGEHDLDYLDDHAAAVREIASTRPWIDLGRVGIYGHSGGGRASTAAMFHHPDLYKVAVSLAGNHDDLLNHPVWSEKYIGFVHEVDYRAHANATYAAGLAGKLLLIHGELDDNVHLPMTLRLVDALIENNKDFDLLIVPNADHAMIVHEPYWIRRRWDYFVQHLLGQTPPSYRIADIHVTIDAIAEEFDVGD